MKCKRFIIFILVLSIAVNFCACKSRTGEKEEKQKGAREITVIEPPKPLSRAESKPLPEEKPVDGDIASIRDKVDSFLKAAKTGERDQIQPYADYYTLFGLEQGQDADWILQQVLMRMKYEIFTVEKKNGDNKAIVSVKFSNIDMTVLLPVYFQQAMELEFNNALSNAPKSADELEKEYRAIFVGLASKNAEARIEKLADIALEKKDGDWKIKPDKKLGDAMLGGYSEVRENIALADFVHPDAQYGDNGNEEAAADGGFDYEANEFSMEPPRE